MTREIIFRYTYSDGNLIIQEEKTLADIERGIVTAAHSRKFLIARDQFTGLFDSAGNKIFEGDIVKMTETCKILGEKGSFEQICYIGVIEWDKEGADYNITPIKDADEDNLRGLGTSNQIIKIIGNIHQNKDLPNVPLIGKIIVDNTINKRLNDR